MARKRIKKSQMSDNTFAELIVWGTGVRLRGYTRYAAGNEAFQLYLYNIATRTATMLPDGKSPTTEPVWSNVGNRIVYSSTPLGESGVNLRLIDRFETKSDRLIAKSTGTHFKRARRQANVFCDFSSNTVSTLWLVDVANGSKTQFSPKTERSELLTKATASW